MFYKKIELLSLDMFQEDKPIALDFMMDNNGQLGME